MTREKLFISYSHRDREWLERLQEHLAILERWGLVHVWSDTRVEVGAGWEREIESALSASRVAVLLISPAFLASRYIWEEERPRILTHSRQGGMVILPLIVRACAWRLDDDLRRLLVRPTDGRPLAVGSDAQIDLDLAAFAYELAARLDRFPSDLASTERETAEQHHAGLLRRSWKLRSGGSVPGAEFAEEELPSVWRARYNDDYDLELRIDSWNGSRFTGTMIYPGFGTVTRVEGHRADTEESIAVLQQLGVGAHTRDARAVLVFRETAIITQGRKSIDRDGEYRAAVLGESLHGAWFKGQRKIGEVLARPG